MAEPAEPNDDLMDDDDILEDENDFLDIGINILHYIKIFCILVGILVTLSIDLVCFCAINCDLNINISDCIENLNIEFPQKQIWIVQHLAVPSMIIPISIGTEYI